MAKTGLTWVGGKTLRMTIDRITKEEIEQKRDQILVTLDGVAADTAEFMRGVIDTTPSSIRPGKPNRVDTGVMQDSVKYKEYTSTGPKTWVVEAGWVDVVRDYFLVQEHGGMSSGLERGDRVISPMHMLTAGLIHMREQLIKDLSKI